MSPRPHPRDRTLPPGGSAAFRERRRAWLAAVNAALAEASAIVDAMAAEGVETADARAALDAARASGAELGARVGLGHGAR